MTIDEVLKVLADSYNLVVHYQTVRNWQNPKKGHRGVFMPKDPSEAEVHAFIAITGTEFKRGRPKSKLMDHTVEGGTMLFRDGISSVWKVNDKYILRCNGEPNREFSTVQEAMDAGWPVLGATDGKNGTGSQITE